MTDDIRDRLDRLSRRADVGTHDAFGQLERARDRRTRSRKVGAITVALAIAVAGTSLAVTGFRDDGAPSGVAGQPSPEPDAPWTAPETITVWPESPMGDRSAEQIQDALDGGDDSLSWRTDPQRVAQRFGMFVLGWSEAQVAVADEPETKHPAWQTFAIRPKCDGDEGANQPCGYSDPLIVHVVQPVREGDGGVWSVAAVQGPGLDIDVPIASPATALTGGSTIRFELRAPDHRSVHIGVVARNGCAETTSFAPGLDAGRHTLTLDEASPTADADAACGGIGAGYAFAYAQDDTTVPVGDPLLEAAAIEYPWLTIVPLHVEMIEGDTVEADVTG